MPSPPPVDRGGYTPPTNMTVSPGGEFIPYQGDGGSIAIFAVLVALTVVGFIVVWKYITYRRESASLINKLHFVHAVFDEKTRPVDLSGYNRLMGVIGFMVIAVIFVPPALFGRIRDEALSMGLIAAGWMMGSLMIIIVYYMIQFREVKKNSNTLWIDVEVHRPGEMSVRRLWKRVVRGPEIDLSKDSIVEIARESVDAAVRLGKISAQDRNRLIEQLQKMEGVHVYRCTVDEKWPLLVVLDGDWKEVVRTREEVMLDETTEVNVLRTFWHVVYLGETTRIVDDIEDGTPTKRELTMGVYAIILAPDDVDSKLREGHFVAPSRADVELATIKHVAQQQAVTADSYQSKVSKLTKTQRDLDEERLRKVVEGATQFNVFMRGFKRLFDVELMRDTFVRTTLIFIIAGFIWYVVFRILGVIP